MRAPSATAEPTFTRQVYPSWSIRIPYGMYETFVTDGDYWHARDDRRSVSMTSIVVTDRKGRPVPARKVIRACPPFSGQRVELPPGLDGWGVAITVPESPVASTAISGILAVDGRILLATVTCDDRDWAGSVWSSIRCCVDDDVGRKDGKSARKA
jgi:hypothetical protein